MMKTPTGVSRAVAEKLTRAYKVGHDVGLKGWASATLRSKRTTGRAKNEDRNETSIRQRAAEAWRDERD